MRTRIDQDLVRTPGMEQLPGDDALYSPRVRSRFSADYWAVIRSAVAGWGRQGESRCDDATGERARSEETACPH